ncbi:MAG: (Fe-S)-binding protein [bacterium]
MLEYRDIDPFISKCVRCGTCKAVFGLYLPSCPAGERFRFEGFYSSGKIWAARGLKEGLLRWDDPELLKKLFACTLCGNCTQQCPMQVREKMLEVFEALRAEAVRREAGPLPGHKKLKDSLVQYRNPWMQPRRRRTHALRDLGVKILSGKDPARAAVLYFVGCTAGLDPSLEHIVRNTIALLQKAGVDFGVLGEEEVCCGSVMLRIGERELAREMARKNQEWVRKLGVKTIVTSCAGCYKTLRQDQAGLAPIPARVVHSSTFFLELVAQGRLSFQGADALRVTYHDPCHLGRHCGLYEAPRKLLKALPGVDLREMPRNRQNAWCCGAGGGVRSAFPEWAVETSRLRVEEAEATGADALVTACPFCLQNLRTGLQASQSGLAAMDLTDLLADRSRR